ncbi:MAG TPA: nuclear transport factor 2 family protein [Chloroflexota bacterium]|nr:nuclear transport factor 2 family protein [Chloroflexota bacterium]
MSEAVVQVSNENQQAVKSTIERYAALRKSGDIEGLVNLFTAEGSVMPPGAPTSTGPEALRAAYEPFRTALGLECTYQFDEILCSGDLASARTRSTGTVLNRDTGEQSPASWRELFVLRRVAGQWRIAQYMFQGMGS